MASDSQKTWKKRQRRLRNSGKKRKSIQGKRSTLTATELFAALGEPGKPAPAPRS